MNTGVKGKNENNDYGDFSHIPNSSNLVLFRLRKHSYFPIIYGAKSRLRARDRNNGLTSQPSEIEGWHLMSPQSKAFILNAQQIFSLYKFF
jgi:hypothetical protein